MSLGRRGHYDMLWYRRQRRFDRHWYGGGGVVVDSLGGTAASQMESTTIDHGRIIFTTRYNIIICRNNGGDVESRLEQRSVVHHTE